MEKLGFNRTKSNNYKKCIIDNIGKKKMTQSQKALKNVFKTYNKKTVKGPAVIIQQRDFSLPEEVADQVEKKQVKVAKPVVELDDNEKQFIDKYIEYSELSVLNSSAEQIISTFEKTLGQNATKAIEILGKKSEERTAKIKELAKELTKLKDEIVKETQKARAKATLISLADAIPVEQPAKRTAKDKKMVVINNESKKKNKK